MYMVYAQAGTHVEAREPFGERLLSFHPYVKGRRDQTQAMT